MSTSTSPAPATGPRAMAEQNILKIIWPPDGRPAWEDRHKIPRIERALDDHLLDEVESDGAVQATVSISAQESQKLTERAIALRQQGMKLRQIADILGLTEKAVSSRISAEMKKQTISRVQTGQRVTSDGRPAALRSAAPDQSVEANNMIEDIGSANANHIVEANDMVAQSQPKVEQVARPTAALQEGPKPDEKPSGLEQKQPPKSEKVPLTDSQKDEIKRLSASGMKPKEIAVQLGIQDARRVQGIIMQNTHWDSSKNVPVVQKDGTSAEPAKDVMLLQSKAEDKAPELQTSEVRSELLNVAHAAMLTRPQDDAPPAPKPTEDKPAPKAMTRAETDKKMWDLWKSGKSPKEIADILWDEQLYYSEKSVTVRLRSQGADI